MTSHRDENHELIASRDELVSCVKAAQRGDSSAQRALFDRYQHRVMGYCMLSSNYDRELAKDLMQEILTRVFTRLHTLEHPERFEPWLWTIAARVTATQSSKRQRYRELLEAWSLEREVLLNQDDKLAQERRLNHISDLLDGVKDETLSRILSMFYREPPHTTRQIAQRLGIPHGTVTVKIRRFRLAIKQQLIELFINEQLP